MNVTAQKLREAFTNLKAEATVAGRSAEVSACSQALDLSDESMERLAVAFSVAATKSGSVDWLDPTASAA